MSLPCEAWFGMAYRGEAAAMRSALERAHPSEAEASQALEWAAKKGHAECARILMGLCSPKAHDSQALRFAAQEGHEDCVELLIPASDPRAKDSVALREAAARGWAGCVALLLPVSDPEALAEKGRDAASVAHAQGHAQVAGMIDAFIEARGLDASTASPEPSSRSPLAL